MNVIDMRLRPPLPSLLQSVLYREQEGVRQTRHEDFPRPQSVREASAELLIREMDDADVQYGVIPGRHSAEPFGVIANEEIAAFMARYPDRFVAFAGINLAGDADAWLRNIDRWMSVPGFKGISIEPSISLTQDIRRADDRRLYPIYEDCVRRNIPVNISISALLQRITQRPYEDSDPRQVYQVALDFPRLDIHVAHAGYPWVMEMIGVAFVCTNVWMSTDTYLIPQMPGAGEYAVAANNFIQDRTLFGTNYPAKPFRQMIDAYSGWGWRPGVLSKVLGGNARRLLRMD